ncbi:MAG: FAD-dependent oxidoreductase [Syntrophorhabdus sp.]|nr:FAD-dependent oxidoreductase [Syntrophorhabdus sp.]
MACRLVIIGGVAGGATAAARARRLSEDAGIIVFERGEYVSFANCGLPYYIGDVIGTRDDLMVTTPEEFRARYRVEVRTLSDVLSIDRAAREVVVNDVRTGEGYREPYDRIILSPGAEPVSLPAGYGAFDNVFSLRSVLDADRIKSQADRSGPGTAVIVGAGFIGLEVAENLSRKGVKTTIVERLPQVMNHLDREMVSVVHDHLRENGVDLLLERSISSVAGRNTVSAVLTDRGEEIPCDMLVLSMGIRPDIRLARDCGLAIGDLGGIKVNPLMMTSDPDIFAVGDAVEVNDLVSGFPVLTALAGPANKQGRIAADNALGRRTVYRGTLGTSIVKIFGLTVSSTGASEKTLRMRQVPHLVSYTHSNSHAGYYPGAEMMTIKLIFSPGSGRILGSQIVGGTGVDKRIDVMATAIRGSMTVFDLEDIDLAYAPPFSSARDPVNIAGFVASNILKGDHEVVHAGDLKDIGENTVLLDLRDMEDLMRSSPIEGAVHVPLGRLRKKMEKLDREKLYITYCEVGTRSYAGHRVLAQRGFKSKNLSGGYKTYTATMRGH